jgi:Reversibly glycosylated polypeptide
MKKSGVKPLVSLVVTSIGDGNFLEAYIDNFKHSGVLEQVEIIVIPDKKTPTSLLERCSYLKTRGANIFCPSLEEQEDYLKKIGISELILYNSDHRRNIGFLMAFENESDFMISIDDDNICGSDGFIKEHSVVCQGELEMQTVNSTNGWFNICDLIEVQPQNVYPRGFPYRFRNQYPEILSQEERGTIHVNAGLWLESPDLDAITWLANPARALSFRGQSVCLGRETWSPINTQNTALNHDAIVAFYFVRMGYQIAGLQIDRYGDIFSGYFCQACVRHLGYRVRVGTPMVIHNRNTHNYLRDLTNELACIWLIEDIAEWLRELKLEGRTYVETYLCLANAIEEAVEKFSGFIWNDSTRGYFHQMAHHMRIWTGAIRTIAGEQNA